MTLRPSGKRPFLVRFERRVFDRGPGGHDVAVANAILGSFWVDIWHGKGSERREAAGQAASILATFVANSCPALREVTEQDQIRWDGRLWDIHSIAPTGLNQTLEFTATVRKA
jgi:hypothetical protein